MSLGGGITRLSLTIHPILQLVSKNKIRFRDQFLPERLLFQQPAKTHREVIWVFPRAVYWGRPNHGDFRQADECILPFLGKEVWVRKMRGCRTDFHFEIKDTGGLIVLPNWIDHFESEDLIPPAEWKDPDCEWADDTWIDHFEDRFFVIGDTLIIHG
jgi:hypothetical protein